VISHGAQMSTLISWQVAQGRVLELREAELSGGARHRPVRRRHWWQRAKPAR
jgi:hypothetical protein